MAIETIYLNSNRTLPHAVLSRFGIEEQMPFKALFGKMGILLLKESASLSDILLTLEEIKTLYANDLRELDREWDDFTLSEEWLSSDFAKSCF